MLPSEKDCEPSYSKQSWKFSRIYLSSADRFPGDRRTRVFLWLCKNMGWNNVVKVGMTAMARDMGIPLSTLYRDLDKLRAVGALAKIIPGPEDASQYRKISTGWMIDPSIVYAGDFKYHRPVTMQFGIFIDRQKQELSTRKGTRGKRKVQDEQQSEPDLQQGSGAAGDCASDPVA